jgi:flagellar basal-body rod protein FlgB
MYQNLDLFRIAGDMARHAALRQTVVATNIANADTPGYRAQRIGAFAETFRDGPALSLRATRPGHLTAPAAAAAARTVAAPARTEPSPNGNTVSIETELLAGVEAQREHSRALAIYRHALTVIRTSLGR